MKATLRKSQRSYHHGDLRNALILAAAELIEEHGSLDFAMADAARRAGVSTAAPYRHFRDRDALLTAVAELAFIGLQETSAKAIVGREPGSVEALIALGENYISYMLSHAAFNDLMWGDIGARAAERFSSTEEGFRNSGFMVLVDVVSAWCDKQGVSGEDVYELATKLWAMVHGLSSLALAGQINRFYEAADTSALLASSTRTFLEGLKASSRAA
jgi:AcrR family transcriptional regulator